MIDIMADPHHIAALIASSITECSKHNPAWVVQAEEAKVMAKCIIEQLRDAGYDITAVGSDRAS
jgi:hypothetical protein